LELLGEVGIVLWCFESPQLTWLLGGVWISDGADRRWWIYFVAEAFRLVE
jgi:hypothetical protein